MKKSTLLLLISTALFFTSTLILLYLNYLKPTSTSTPTTGIIPTDSPIPTTDPVADWKIYTNKEYGFEFKYPSKYHVKTSNTLCFTTDDSERYCDIYLDPQKISISAENTIQKALSLPKTLFLKDFAEQNSWNYSEKNINNYKLIAFNQAEGPGEGVFHHYIYSNDKIVDFSTTKTLFNSDTLYQILSTFKFTDQKEESAIDVAKKYLNAYVSQDWATAKQYCSDPNFDEAAAKGYSFVKYTITGQKADTKANYYHVYVSFTDKSGEVYSQAPYSSGPLEVLLAKNQAGEWKALTWYFYP